MFTITVAAAVVIINKSDLAPVLEEFTRSPPVIPELSRGRRRLPRRECSSPLFLRQRRERLCKDGSICSRDLPTCSHRIAHQGRGFGKGLCAALSLWHLDWETWGAGSRTPPHCSAGAIGGGLGMLLSNHRGRGGQGPVGFTLLHQGSK